MSYIVLARRWRPQSFKDLIGQDAIAQTLRNAIATNRVVHAYIFSGPRGVGKTSTARILAKALNCENRKDSEPCNRCPNCIAITNGSSVDVIEIDGASNNSVEAVRELRETVKYAPSSGRYKIYIIDEVHMLSTSAFNALLKTLEEPPEHVIFIFATTEPKKIPRTILSRSQHHAFRRVPSGVIKEHLKGIVSKEGIKIRDSALDIIARAADGSIRDALTLLDQAASFSDDISDRELEILMGLPESNLMARLSRLIIEGDVQEILYLIKDLSDRGTDLRQIIRELIDYFRNIAMIKVIESPEKFLEISEEVVNNLRPLADTATPEQITLILSELIKLEGEVRTSTNPRFALELGLMRMSFIKGMTSIESLINQLSTESQGDTDTPIEKPKRGKDTGCEDRINSNEASPLRLDPASVWDEAVKRIDSCDHLLACKMQEATVIGIEDRVLTIGFNGGLSVLAESIKKNEETITACIRDITGKDLGLKVITIKKKENKESQQSLKERVISEPIVQDAIRIFNGSLIRVKSIKKDN